MAARMDMCRGEGLRRGRARQHGRLPQQDRLPAHGRRPAPLQPSDRPPAHDRGLAVGLKNDLDQIPELVGDFDFAVNEQCAQYEECDGLTPFIEAGKAVFHVEYEMPNGDFCPEARRLELSSLLKK